LLSCLVGARETVQSSQVSDSTGRANGRARLPGCFKEAEPWAVVGAQAMGLMGNQKFDDLIFLKLWNISRPKNTVNDSQAKSKKGQPSGDR